MVALFLPDVMAARLKLPLENSLALEAWLVMAWIDPKAPKLVLVAIVKGLRQGIVQATML